MEKQYGKAKPPKHPNTPTALLNNQLKNKKKLTKVSRSFSLNSLVEKNI